MHSRIRTLAAAIAATLVVACAGAPAYAETLKFTPGTHPSCEQFRDFTDDLINDDVSQGQFDQRWGRVPEAHEEYYARLAMLTLRIQAEDPALLPVLPALIYDGCVKNTGV